MLRKSDKPDHPGLPGGMPEDPTLKALHPNLWDHLYQTKWDDGSPRETSSMLFFAQDGMLKACIKDKANGLCLWVSARSMGALIDAVEAALADPGSDWRVDRQFGEKTASRVQASARQKGR